MKTKKIKVFNFLSKIAAALKNLSQKFQSFLSNLFLEFYIFLKEWISKHDFHLPSRFVHMINDISRNNLSVAYCFLTCKLSLIVLSWFSDKADKNRKLANIFLNGKL